LSNSSADQDNATLSESVVVARSNLKRMRERHGVTNVVGFCFGSVGVLVDQDNFATNALHYQSVSRRCPNEPAADNANLHH